MYDHYLIYLNREHARLEAEISNEESRPFPDTFAIARLKKLKLAVKDQIAACPGEESRSRAA